MAQGAATLAPQASKVPSPALASRGWRPRRPRPVSMVPKAPDSAHRIGFGFALAVQPTHGARSRCPRRRRRVQMQMQIHRSGRADSVRPKSGRGKRPWILMDHNKMRQRIAGMHGQLSLRGLAGWQALERTPYRRHGRGGDGRQNLPRCSGLWTCGDNTFARLLRRSSGS